MISWRMLEAGDTRRPPGHDDGFTLLELLVSLAILSLALLLLPQALQLAGRASATASAVQRAAGHAAVASFVGDRLSRALPLHRRDGDGTRTIAFRGGPDMVRFVAPVDSRAWGTGLLDYEITTRIEGNGLALWLRSAPFRPGQQGDGQWAGGRSEMLVRVAALDIRYFGEQEDGVRGWTSSWSRRDVLPEAVELRIAPETGGPPLRAVLPLQPMRLP